MTKANIANLLGTVLAASVPIGCGLPSRIPYYAAATRDGPAGPYLIEASTSALSHSFWDEGFESADGKWKFIVRKQNRDEDLADFYVAVLRNMASASDNTLFTLWDADVGSGLSMEAAWSRDSKALHLKGRTRGFAYRRPKDEAFGFDFIYLVDKNQMFSLVEDR